MRPVAFTLIETMLAVLLMALLASAVSLSFSKPLQTARTQDAMELIRSFDLTARQAAINTGRPARMVFDLSDGSLTQLDGSELNQIRRHLTLPSGCKINGVKTDGRSTTIGPVAVDISPHGWSKTYTVHVMSRASDRWLVFAGLTGQMTQVNNESQIPIYSDPIRHNAD